MESLYHYLWSHRILGTQFLMNSGEVVEVINPGIHNTDAGPDFTSARIVIDGEEWIGNVEIHVKASDWQRHGHHDDPAYDSVVLHVVGVDDCPIHRKDGSTIPQICLAPAPDFFQRYLSLTEDIDTPGCLSNIDTIPSLNRKDWINTLGIERLHEKADYMKEVLRSSNGDWKQALFIILARAMGFGLNGLPFELLAKSLPLNFVMRHRDNSFQIEALLFGQAGMLDSREYQYDDYYGALCREYSFLKAKYGLTPINGSLWKYARTRPQNFPHRRIGILSAMLEEGLNLHTVLIEKGGKYEEICELFKAEASSYWRHHYRFGMAESELPIPVTLSQRSIDILCINLVAPFYFGYGSLTGNPDIAEKGIDLLYEIAPERNSVVGIWNATGIKATCAFESQALLRLRRGYCQASRCLECRFGHYLLRHA